MSLGTGTGLKALRQQMGLTQAAFAVLIGAHEKSVARWEARRRIPLRVWLSALAVSKAKVFEAVS